MKYEEATTEGVAVKRDADMDEESLDPTLQADDAESRGLVDPTSTGDDDDGDDRECGKTVIIHHVNSQPAESGAGSGSLIAGFVLFTLIVMIAYYVSKWKYSGAASPTVNGPAAAGLPHHDPYAGFTDRTPSYASSESSSQDRHEMAKLANHPDSIQQRN